MGVLKRVFKNELLTKNCLYLYITNPYATVMKSVSNLKELKRALDQAESLITLQSALIEAQNSRIYDLENGLRIANALMKRSGVTA